MPTAYRLKESEHAADLNVARIEVGADGSAVVTYAPIASPYGTLDEALIDLGLSADDLEPVTA